MVGDTAKRELMGEFPNQVIRASAGTGKTFSLSNRYLKLLASGAECQTILATTFTRKGAGEILDRIVGRLSDAALDADAAKKLAKELEWNLDQDRAAEILHELLQNLHRLEISTLDSFFNRVAKAFSLELGLPPTWDIVEELQMDRLYDQAIQAVLRRDAVLDLLHMLSKGQAARRVASMIRETVENAYTIFRESGPEPWDQLSMTGKFLPADKLELLVNQIANLEPEKKSLRKHWEEVKRFAMSDDWAAFASTRSFQNLLDGNPKYGNTKLTEDILEIYRQALPHCTAFVEKRLIEQNLSTRDLLGAFGNLLEEAKSETGHLRFDDVTARLQEFVSMWDTERFSFRLDHQIQHLLLDEFQDTSLAQWNVIRPFAQKVTESSESLRSFFCVGDMKQAIFGWRGGVAEIFDLVDRQLPNLDVTQTLTKSYRSAPPVIDMVNNIFMNVDRYQCKDNVVAEAIRKWSTWFSPHSTERTELKGYVSIEMAKECDQSVKGIEWSKDSERNTNVTLQTVQRVKELTQTLPPDRTIGVIVRTNNEVGELIFRFQQAGIRASEEGGNPLTDSAAVELVLSAIRLADFPGDGVARFHLSHSPLADSFGLKPESELNQNENQKAAIKTAAQRRSELVDRGYGPTVEKLAKQLTAHCTRRELLRLQQLVQIAYASPTDNGQWQLRPSQFVQYVRNEVKVSDQSSASVRVMTIHKAKGLEFDVVVFPIPLSSQGWAGLTPNVVVGRENPTAPINVATRYANKHVRRLLPPKFQAIFEEDRQRNVRESMCVLYVALTRAAHATHVIVSHGAKVDHQSAAGILMATLCPNEERRQGLLYEHGDPVWFQSAQPDQADPDPHQLAQFYLPEDAKLRKGNLSFDVRSGRGMPRTLPSMLEGGDELVLGSIFKSDEHQQAMSRGTLLHGCFELVQWLDRTVPTRQQLLEHLKTIDPTAEWETIIDSFYEMIEHENVKRLLTMESYQETYLMHFPETSQIMIEANRLEVENERRFAVQLEAGLMQGVIDRLVLVYEGDRLVAADVIDFKTDTVAASETKQRVEYYKPQLSAYREAASQFLQLPIEKVSSRLLFVESGHLENLHLLENSFSPDQAKGLPAPKRKTHQTKSTEVPQQSSRVPKRKLRSRQQKTLWPED